MIDLSVITVTHQSVHQIETLINSVISGALQSQIEHIIVDNASRDGTSDLIKERYLSFVTLLENKDNVGFSAANNRGFALSKGRYVLFLNPDMKVEDGSLDAFVQWMDAHSEVGVAGCKLIDSLGQWMANRAPSCLPKWGQCLFWLLSLSKLRDSLGDLTAEQDVEFVIGSFLIARRCVLERLGFAFDPQFFLTFEDADLCREVKRLGYRVVYNPLIRCVDYNSRSFAQKPVLWTYKQAAHGMLVYFRKWSPWYQWLTIALCIPIGYAIRFLKNNRQKNRN